MLQNISTDIAIVDVDANKLKGEMMDLNHGSCFLNSAKVAASVGLFQHLFSTPVNRKTNFFC